jgi:hypothetical protein
VSHPGVPSQSRSLVIARRCKQYRALRSLVNNHAENLLFKSLSAAETRFWPHRTFPMSQSRRIDQRSMAFYLHLKAMSAQVISDDLVVTLGAEALAYSPVMKYLRKAQFDPTKVPSNSHASSPHIDNFARAILAALEEKPFSSVRELARATHLPPTTVHSRLTNSFGFRLRHLCWGRSQSATCRIVFVLTVDARGKGTEPGMTL